MTDRRKSLEQGARRINKTAKTLMHDPDFVWFVMFTMAGKEFIAQKMLTRFGLVNYLPLHRKWRRVNRTTKEKRRFAYPALSGCLFVAAPKWWADWDRLFDLTPIYGVLGISGRAIRFEGIDLHDFLEINKSKFEVPDEQRHMRTHHEFEVGDQVLVVDGALDGRVYEVEDIEGPNAKILIKFLGKTQYVDVALDKLEKAA